MKRRRGTSRTIEDDEDVEDFQSIYGHLKQAGLEQKSGSNAIEARLDKLTSMIERLSKSNQALDPAERQLLAQNVGLESVRDLRQQQGIAQVQAQPPRPAVSSRPESRSDSPRRTAESSGDEFPIPAGHATDLVDPVGSLNLGHLSLDDGGRSR